MQSHQHLPSPSYSLPQIQLLRLLLLFSFQLTTSGGLRLFPGRWLPTPSCLSSLLPPCLLFVAQQLPIHLGLA
ncbi:hypothetical protein L1887_15479 [Cichorium endivia]|nr:hypothetical protein L1887_15479 [Cichorium endivia]